MRYTVVAALVAALPFGRALPPTIAYFTDLSNFETDLIDWAAFGILGDVSAHLTVNASYRFPGRRYFAAHADELLCARSGRRQRSNAAKIIQDGLRLVERGLDAGTAGRAESMPVDPASRGRHTHANAAKIILFGRRSQVRRVDTAEPAARGRRRGGAGARPEGLRLDQRRRRQKTRAAGTARRAFEDWPRAYGRRRDAAATPFHNAARISPNGKAVPEQPERTVCAQAKTSRARCCRTPPRGPTSSSSSTPS